MLCPLCKMVLVSGGVEQFETLDDHVCCPNDDPPFRPTVVCPNVQCEANKDGMYWDSWFGEGPYHSDWDKNYAWIDGNSSPFDSHARKAEFAIEYKAEDRQWCNQWFMVKREVRYASNDHGDKVGKRVRYQLYVKDSYGNYAWWKSGVNMLVFGLKQFYTSYDRKSKARSIVKMAGYQDAEWWRKVEALWIKTFHGKYLKGE